MAIDFNPIMPETCDPNDSMIPPYFEYTLKPEFLNENRKFQGVPAMERTENGRLYFAFYSGGEDEGIGNFIPVFMNDDDGKTEEQPSFVVMPSNSNTTRVYDPCFWIDPQKRLWFFVAQAYTYYDGRCGVWASICENPDDEKPIFTPFRRIANGIMMNKPIIHQGEWLLPCAIWDKFKTIYNNIPEERYSNVYVSKDNGETFQLLSHTDYLDRYVDEHMMVELSDGRIMMLIRGKHGIGVSYSQDHARTWSHAVDSGLGGPCARFNIKKLKSGRLLFINHYHFEKRNNLTAMLSEDDGKTWKGFLLLDERSDVSYPDSVETKDGQIYVIYDHDRYHAKEIMMAVITEEDILAGKLVNEKSRLKVVINHATGENT